jgi:hypothetical protein
MARGYHTWRPRSRPADHGQVAVEPLCDGREPRPHDTWHAPVQLFTVQPVAGQVTSQSGLDPQSTEQDDA